VPVIGVVASSQRGARRYLDAMVKREVAEYLLVPRPLSQIDETIASVDGLLFTGGSDVDPHLYGQARDPNAGLRLSPHRDRWELGLLKASLERDMPVLGICRGMQLLNVAFGGSLIQDVPGHRLQKQNDNRESGYHHVYISPGSKLAAILGSGGFVRVNSLHHQGLREPQKAATLMASVYSLEDGLIEAVESPQHDCVIGVQWHSQLEEEMPKSFGNLFQVLIERAEIYTQRKEAGQHQRDLTLI
jgi:gamma-glutamyl-gamma-aminobutyrate hydrolase PuuD